MKINRNGKLDLFESGMNESKKIKEKRENRKSSFILSIVKTIQFNQINMSIIIIENAIS